MNTNQSKDVRYSLPFSSYDFFGYLLPGILFVISYLLWAKYSNFKWVDSLRLPTSEIGLGVSLLYLIIGLSIVYFIGQIIGSISHILYDRMLIRNVIGYPLQYILTNSIRPRPVIRSTYISLLIAMSLYIVTPGFLELVLKFWRYSYPYHEKYDILKSIPTLCIVGDEMFLVAFGKCAIVFAFIIMTIVIRQRLRRIEGVSTSRATVYIDMIWKNILVKIFRLAYVWAVKNVFIPLRKISSTDAKLDEHLIQKFKTAMITKYGLSTESSSSDPYWMASIVVSKDQNMGARLTNWLNMYGCLRNYSCTFLIIAFIISTHHWYLILIKGQVHDLLGSRILIASLIFSLLLTMRYWIIYYSYYSKYIIRAFVHIYDEEDENIIIMPNKR